MHGKMPPVCVRVFFFLPLQHPFADVEQPVCFLCKVHKVKRHLWCERHYERKKEAIPEITGAVSSVVESGTCL